MSMPTRPPPHRMGKEKRLAPQQEVISLLRKGAIEPIRDRQAGFYSNLFGRSPDVRVSSSSVDSSSSGDDEGDQRSFNASNPLLDEVDVVTRAPVF